MTCCIASIGGLLSAVKAQDGFLHGVTGSPDYWCPIIGLGSQPASARNEESHANKGSFVDLANPSTVAVLHVPGHEDRKREFYKRLQVPRWSASKVGFVNGTNAYDPLQHDRMLDNTDVFS